VADESERLSRRSHANLDLRAYANPLDVRAEDIHQERVALMAAIETDFLSEQAGRYAETRTTQIACGFQRSLTPSPPSP
jgi:hypothetical protein